MTTVSEAFDLFDKWVRDGCEYHPLLISEMQSAFAEARAEVERLRAAAGEWDALREALQQYQAHNQMRNDTEAELYNIAERTLAAVPAPPQADQLDAALNVARAYLARIKQFANDTYSGKMDKSCLDATDWRSIRDMADEGLRSTNDVPAPQADDRLLAVAERAARAMQEEFRQRATQYGKAWLYEAVRQGWIDAAAIARRAVAKQEVTDG